MMSQELAALSLNNDLQNARCQNLPDFQVMNFESAGLILDLELQLHTPIRRFAPKESLDDLLSMAAMGCPNRILRTCM